MSIDLLYAPRHMGSDGTNYQPFYHISVFNDMFMSARLSYYKAVSYSLHGRLTSYLECVDDDNDVVDLDSIVSRDPAAEVHPSLMFGNFQFHHVKSK